MMSKPIFQEPLPPRLLDKIDFCYMDNFIKKLDVFPGQVYNIHILRHVIQFYL